MATLSDTQRILLSAASQRQDGSVLPLSNSIKPSGGLSRSIAALARGGFAEERETSVPTQVHRHDGDMGYGLFITDAGAAAIGVELADPELQGVADAPVTIIASSSVNVPLKAQPKSEAVLALLGRSEGATMPELIALTGWLPHTTRAALTGLRKKGHDIARTKRDSVTCYRIGGQS